MGKHTLDTDFSALNGPKAHNWILKFRDMADSAFADRDNRSRLLGSLLIIEQYVHTLREGLSADGKQISPVLETALDYLWDYLEGRAAATDFQDFANNIYAGSLACSVGEELTDTQEKFYQEHFHDTELSPVERQIITWVSGLLVEVVAIEGGRLDFEEIADYERISFADIDDLIAFLTDAAISIAGISLLSDKGGDYARAAEQVYQTALFRHMIEHIQNSLQTALNAAPEQYSSLRTEYQKYTIIPAEYIADLMGFQQMY